MTQKDNCIVILKRIYEISGTRSMPLSLSLTALYISSNNHHRGRHLAHRFPVQDFQKPPGYKKRLSLRAMVTSTTSQTRQGGGGREGKELRRGKNTTGKIERAGRQGESEGEKRREVGGN